MTQKIDRFSLEDSIMKCWNVVDDIKLIQEAYSNNTISKENLITALNGISIIQQVNFEKLNCIFNLLIEHKIISSDEVIIDNNKTTLEKD